MRFAFADPSLVEVASSPKGRILPSLVSDEPLRRVLRDAAPTPAESDLPLRAPKRPPVRTSKGKDQKSKLLRNSGVSSGDNAPLAERLSTRSRQTASVQSGDGAGISPRDPMRAPRQVVGESGGLALSARSNPARGDWISDDSASGFDVASRGRRRTSTVNEGTARLTVFLDTTHCSADSSRPRRPCEAKRNKAIGGSRGNKGPRIGRRAFYLAGNNCVIV